MQHRINKLLICAVLAPLGGDIDEYYEKFRNINPNDENEVKPIIKEYLLPYFNQYFSPEGRQKIKEALGYFLSTDDSVDWQGEYNGHLMPFDSHKNAKLFFVWIWEELFPDEDFKLYELSDVRVVESYKDLQKIKNIQGHKQE